MRKIANHYWLTKRLNRNKIKPMQHHSLIQNLASKIYLTKTLLKEEFHGMTQLSLMVLRLSSLTESNIKVISFGNIFMNSDFTGEEHQIILKTWVARHQFSMEQTQRILCRARLQIAIFWRPLPVLLKMPPKRLTCNWENAFATIFLFKRQIKRVAMRSE